MTRRLPTLLTIAALSALCATAQEIDPRQPYSSDGQFNSRFNDQSAKGDSRFTHMRDDILWHAESANVVYMGAGNASLLSATRYGLTERMEISTYLVEDVLRPSVYLKVLWNEWVHRSNGSRVFQVNNGKKWFLASRFNICNAYPGMSLAQTFKVDRLIGQDDEIPLVFEVGHELLLSRAWYNDPNCSDGSVYFIVSAGLGLYGGFNFSHDVPDLKQLGFHFLANRGETLTGDGFRARLKVWADGVITKRFALHGGLAYHVGTFTHHHAGELQGEAEFFFNSRLSIKGGLLFGWANYTSVDREAGIWPIIDLSYYFGKKHSRSSSLFQRGVYKGSKF